MSHQLSPPKIKFNARFFKTRIATFVIACGVICGAVYHPAFAQTVNTHVAVGTNIKAPDNTAVNSRDRSALEKTADDAGMEEPDRNMMRRIRKAVVDDTSLSTDAQNVKIISVNGHVTLKGPVSSSEEKRKIEAKAIAVAGKDNVANELSVK